MKSVIWIGKLAKGDLPQWFLNDDSYVGVIVDAHQQNAYEIWQQMERMEIQHRMLVLQNAVAGDISRVTYYFDHVSVGSGPDNIIKPILGIKRQLQMISVTLDDIFRCLPAPCERLYLDADGSELAILEGFSFSEKPAYIRVETHNHIIKNATEKIIELLSGIGYSLTFKKAWKLGHFLEWQWELGEQN